MEQHKLKRWFNVLDREKKGELPVTELHGIIRRLGYIPSDEKWRRAPGGRTWTRAVR